MLNSIGNEITGLMVYRARQTACRATLSIMLHLCDVARCKLIFCHSLVPRRRTLYKHDRVCTLCDARWEAVIARRQSHDAARHSTPSSLSDVLHQWVDRGTRPPIFGVDISIFAMSCRQTQRLTLLIRRNGIMPHFKNPFYSVPRNATPCIGVHCSNFHEIVS